MNISIIKDEAKWQAMENQWNELLETSISNVPFLRHEFLSAWWQHRGGGEWPEDSQLYIIAAHNDDEQLIGIAPTFLSKNHTGAPILVLLGSVEISDFLDVIVSPENHRAFLEAVLEFLISPDGPDWDCLDLYNLLDDSPTLPVLEELAADFSLRFFQEQIQPSPYIPLPNDFDDYLNGLDKKYRHEMKRKMRNAAKYPIPISWNYIEDETELEQAFNDFGELMREDKEKNTFLTPPMVAQMWAIVQAAFKAGYLRLGFLNVGKDRAVGMLNFDYANRIWVYNSGMSAKHESVSPGILLTSHMMLEAIENGREAFDMMRGGEDYKYHMGGIDRFVIRASVMR